MPDPLRLAMALRSTVPIVGLDPDLTIVGARTTGV
jgi:hypothetical protein